MSVDLHISTHPSKFAGYQAKAGSEGKITLFISTIWDQSQGDYDRFLDGLAYTYLLERVCLERAFQRIRMTDRCEPVCKLLRIADLMMYPEEWPPVREYWVGSKSEA
jgi:hypothetical protein